MFRLLMMISSNFEVGVEAKKTLNKTKSRATTTTEKPRQVVMQSYPNQSLHLWLLLCLIYPLFEKH